MRKIVLASLAAVLFLGLAGLVVAQPPMFHHMHGEGMGASFHEQIAKELGLSEDQMAAAKKIHQEAMAKAEPLMEQHRQQMAEIHTLLDEGTATAEEIGTKVIAAHATGEQLRAIHDETFKTFSALLTEEQKAKLETIKSDMHNRMMMGGMGEPEGF